MKKILGFFILTTLLALFLTACWKPSVTAVPITAPWEQMNLPVKDNAIVWASSDKQLKVVHKDSKKTVMGKYVDAFKAQGWTLANFDDKSDSRYVVDLAKGADKVEIEIYDFENTGVIIEKK